jgi:hypothetical protein
MTVEFSGRWGGKRQWVMPTLSPGFREYSLLLAYLVIRQKDCSWKLGLRGKVPQRLYYPVYACIAMGKGEKFRDVIFLNCG